MTYICRCMALRFLVAWLSLVSTCVWATSISFERKVNEDIFKSYGKECSQMGASLYVNGWCKCDYGKIFVGKECMARGDMSGKSSFKFLPT